MKLLISIILKERRFAKPVARVLCMFKYKLQIYCRRSKIGF